MKILKGCEVIHVVGTVSTNKGNYILMTVFFDQFLIFQDRKKTSKERVERVSKRKRNHYPTYCKDKRKEIN